MANFNNHKEVLADIADAKSQKAKKEHAAKVAAWLKSRPEVGALTGVSPQYYRYTESGRLVQVQELSQN